MANNRIIIRDGKGKKDRVTILPEILKYLARKTAISPVPEQISRIFASDFKGRLKVGKVNVDEAQDLAGNYSVMSIPTLLFFKKGKIVEQVVGVMSKEQLVEKIESII